MTAPWESPLLVFRLLQAIYVRSSACDQLPAVAKSLPSWVNRAELDGFDQDLRQIGIEPSKWLDDCWVLALGGTTLEAARRHALDVQLASRVFEDVHANRLQPALALLLRGAPRAPTGSKEAFAYWSGPKAGLLAQISTGTGYELGFLLRALLAASVAWLHEAMMRRDRCPVQLAAVVVKTRHVQQFIHPYPRLDWKARASKLLTAAMERARAVLEERLGAFQIVDADSGHLCALCSWSAGEPSVGRLRHELEQAYQSAWDGLPPPLVRLQPIPLSEARVEGCWRALHRHMGAVRESERRLYEGSWRGPVCGVCFRSGAGDPPQYADVGGRSTPVCTMCAAVVTRSEPGTRRRPAYRRALLQLDGDFVGEWMSGAWTQWCMPDEAGPGMAYPIRLSSRLHAACDAIREEVRGRNGRSVYAGGDDLVFQMSEDEVAETSLECERLFRSETGGLTLSGAIVSISPASGSVHVAAERVSRLLHDVAKTDSRACTAVLAHGTTSRACRVELDVPGRLDPRCLDLVLAALDGTGGRRLHLSGFLAMESNHGPASGLEALICLKDSVALEMRLRGSRRAISWKEWRTLHDLAGRLSDPTWLGALGMALHLGERGIMERLLQQAQAPGADRSVVAGAQGDGLLPFLAALRGLREGVADVGL